MPEVRLLVPVTDNDGKEHPAGEVIDVDVETAEAWRAAGKVSLVSMEGQAEGGHYSEVTTREDVAPLGGGQLPGPQAEENDEDDDKPRARGKK